MGIKNFYRGDTKKYRLKVKDKQTGKPISVHNGQLFVTFKINKTDEDMDAVLQKSVMATEADQLDPTGEVEIVLSSSETDIEPVTYYYDFQFVSSSGEVVTVLSDKVKVLADITRSVT